MVAFDLSRLSRRNLTIGSISLIAALMTACGGNNPSSSSAPASSSSSVAVSSSSISSSSSSSVASSSSSSVPGGTVSCAEAAFCDDFESNNIGAQPQGGWTVSGQASISNERVFSGNRAVKVMSQGGGYNRNFISLNLNNYADTQQQMYGRMMVYLSSQNELGGDFTLVQADGNAKPASAAPSGTQAMYRARIDGRYDHMMANYDTSNGWSTDCWAHPEFNENTGTPPASEYILPKNQWACVEWHFDAQADELMYWLNGAELSQIHVSKVGDGCIGQSQQNLWYAPQQFNTLHLGVEQYHNSARARTMYIDDVRVDNRYIGCPDGQPQSSSSSVASSSASVSSSTSSSSSVQQFVTGEDWYREMCVGCHGTTFGRGISRNFVSNTSASNLAAFISAAMPKSPQSPSDCIGECATKIADYLKSW